MSDLPYLLSPDPTTRERVNTPPPSFRGPLLLGPYSYRNDLGTKFQVSPPRTPFGAIHSHHLASQDADETMHPAVTVREKSPHHLKVRQVGNIGGTRSQSPDSFTTSSASRDWSEGLRHARHSTSAGFTLSDAAAQDKLSCEDRHRTLQATSKPEPRGYRASNARKSILKTSTDSPLAIESSRKYRDLHFSDDHRSAQDTYSAPHPTHKSRRRSKTGSDTSTAGHARRATDSTVTAPSRTETTDRQALALRRQAIYRDASASIPTVHWSSSDENLENKRSNRSTMGSLTPSTTASTLGDSGSSTAGRQTKSVILSSAKGPSALALRRRVVLADLDLNSLAAQIRPARPALRERTSAAPAPPPYRPLRIVKRTDHGSLDAMVRAALVVARADVTRVAPPHPIVLELMGELDCAIESWRHVRP